MEGDNKQDTLGQLNFRLAVKTLPQEGNLVYEYNPFRNFRLEEDKFFYRGKYYNAEELVTQLNSIYPINLIYDSGQIKYNNGENVVELINWSAIKWGDNEGIPPEDEPILYESGSLVDFETNELSFDLNHPVDILPQYSYDGSVNLIINDGKNEPRLINSRFSPVGRNRYQVNDRKGNNDTNIYDSGNQFDIDTSLYKKTIKIPAITFQGVNYGGQMPIGNYHFYFKYLDADGNETDFVGESGLVSIFIGNSPNSIKSGFRLENSNKLVRFSLSEIDSSYQYIRVYYSRSTSDILENAVTSVYRIEDKFLVNALQRCNIVITGFEQVTEVPVEEINPKYQICSAVGTQASCKNRLFFANVSEENKQYEKLTQLSLRITPNIVTEKYEAQIDENYSISNNLGYYDPNYIYNKTGYWYDEMYRLGIVYILSNNTLSPVFNIRGGKIEGNNVRWSTYKKYDDEVITWSEDNFLVNPPSEKNKKGQVLYENAKGVIFIGRGCIQDPKSIIGINVTIEEELIDELRKCGIQGFFIVRQKRIPTTLCQAYTIGIDPESHTPILPIGDKFITESFISQDKSSEFCENKNDANRLEKDPKILTHDLDSRLLSIESKEVKNYAAICPEYDINSPYFNSLFTGSEFIVKEALDSYTSHLNKDSFNPGHYYNKLSTISTDPNSYITKILGVEDNVKLTAIDDIFFSARAGEVEEAFRYEYFGRKEVSKDSTNLIRGSYGPFLGLSGYSEVGKVIDIKIPGYSEANLLDYFKIRYNDKSSYYAISERIDITNEFSKVPTLYRGDCYICQYTHRLNRNFQDPSAPINDKIVDKNCWEENYNVTDGVVVKDNFEKINLGDVNAIQLGLWVTFTVRSTQNLCIRAIDDSIPDEVSLIGHPRGFYPYNPISNAGVYKVPEALCCNQGFGKGLSSRFNYEVPDVPYLKNNFSNRVVYSDIQITDVFQNNFRVFPSKNYRDYPQTYGSITKIIELNGNLLCVYEHGIDLLSINERALAGEGSGGPIYINTNNVLPETPKNISDTYGSQWKDSIIKTPKAVYGVDTIAKKIWRTDGTKLEIISDFRIQEFLNNNISLTERELTPIIGIRNVKSHFNKFKQDIMFTFYDNLYGFQERVWNVCYNESKEMWVTFYSWVPSFSENIYNQFFSFNRDTSKYIAKLYSKKGECIEGVHVKTPEITHSKWKTELELLGPSNTNNIQYKLIRDNYGNRNYFTISDDGTLRIKEGKYDELLKKYAINLYQKDKYGRIMKDERGRPIRNKDEQEKTPVIYLNIRASTGFSVQEGEDYVNDKYINSGYYETTIALILKDNVQYLTTAFWKHGQSGIIDYRDPVNPTHWYGKQHPFEFEFVVVDDPSLHKIFDNLEIISNKAAPESFHYEIVGECYDFAKDKKNMYIRQEATKELYQSNGSDVVFNSDYKRLIPVHRPLHPQNKDSKYYDKSTIFPLYYSRQDTINEIEDSYHLHDHNDPYGESDKNFSALAGAEIVRYENLDEYRIWNHAKAVDIKEHGLLRGNMYYKEDKWDVQINPINLVQKNETDIEWNRNDESNPPIVYNLFPLPKDISNITNMEIPNSLNGFNVINWNDLTTKNQEVKMKDKFIKIRVRYSGEDLAIITAIKTLYSISYA